MLEINKIHQGDCLELMKEILNESIDLVVTSPPYNIGMEYGDYNDNLKWEDYLRWCKKWLKECLRVLKKDGRICLNHYIAFRDLRKKDRFPLMDFRYIMEKIGFNFGKIVIWEDKSYAKHTAWGSWLSASSPHIQTPYEGILIGYKKQWKKKNKGITTISKNDFIEGVHGVWNCGTDRKQLTKCCFPLKLPTMCINLLTYKNDLVLDLFMGSGTTAVACIQTRRNFIGIELNESYVKIANKRLSQQVLSNSSPPVRTSNSASLTSDKPKGFNMGLKVPTSSPPKEFPSEIPSPNPNIFQNGNFTLTGFPSENSRSKKCSLFGLTSQKGETAK